MRVLGVDGYRLGWIGATVDAGRVTWQTFPTAAGVVEFRADVTAVDIPMGLPADGERRACDQLARKRLMRAGSSVFDAPPRSLVAEPDMSHAQALDWLRARGLAGMSAQAFGILRKVRDIDAVLEPALQDRVVEAHPELAFRAMLGQDQMASKKSAVGVAERIRAVSRWLDVDAVALLERVPDKVPVDDALDALACAWVAQRFHRGDHETLGDGRRDSRGLLMRIVV